MQTQRINITLPNDLARDFRRTIPNRSRSKFIAGALRERLQQKEKYRHLEKQLAKRLKANREFYKKVAEEWKTTELEGWPE